MKHVFALVTALVVVIFSHAQNTVFDIIVQSTDHETLEELAYVSGWATILTDDPGPFTVFAPTDNAFNSLPDWFLQDLVFDPEGALFDVLAYHILGAEVVTGDMYEGGYEMLNGDEVIVTIDGGVFINDAMITIADIQADNGVVHVIDAVLSTQPYTVMDFVEATPEFSILNDFLVEAELNETLSGSGPFTLFAPTNTAFLDLGPDVLAILSDETNGVLTDLLLYHVLGTEEFSGSWTLPDTFLTLLGEEITVTIDDDSNVLINDAIVLVVDIETSNGVVHIIDSVMDTSYFGCTDASACNYQPSAISDDGSCSYPGCTDSLACNYQPAAACDSGSCTYPGCTDFLACNFDPTAGCDAGTCTYPADDSEDNFSYQGWTQKGAAIHGLTGEDASGSSVALSKDGDVIAIGAVYNDEGGENAGHVRIFSYESEGWTQMGNSIPGENEGDWSGFSISLSDLGNVVAIGSRQNDDNGENAGHVRVFSFDGISWNQWGNDIDGELAYDQSGYFVSLSQDGQIMAIGAPFHSNGSGQGQVRIFQYNGANWTQLGDDIDGADEGDQSGVVSLSADGYTVAIGSVKNSANFNCSGHTRIFHYDGLQWIQVGNDIQGEVENELTGYSVSLSSDGTRVAIGSLETELNEAFSGNARVFELVGSSWVQMGVNIEGESLGDRSGAPVSLSGDGTTLVVGAISNDENGEDAGHARVFKWYNNAWVQLGVDIDGEYAGDNSGYAVSIARNGYTVAVGSPFHDGSFQNEGHVRVFELGCVGCTDPSACNYNASVLNDDGSCLYNGCMDALACNYDANAGCDDGSCTYPGCTDALASNYDPTAACDDGSCIAAFGSLEWQVASTMYYSDTLEVNMLITGGEDVYAAFATIEYDTSVLLMVEDQLGDYLGDEIIATPAVDDNGTVEFGATKLGALPGSNGDGLFYTLRFIPVGPIEATSIETALTVVDIEAYTSEGTPGALYFPDSWSVELIYQAEVWPGDLNHDYEVTVGDILPIGYFYAETGPARPDATLQWEAQLCPLWDVGMDFAGDGFYKVFADGNGDGEIQLSDQVAVGININQVVNLVPSDDQTASLVGGGSSPVLITATSNPDPLVLPEDSEVSLVVYATTDEVNQADFHGISFSLDFESLGIEADLAEVDYSNSGMGVLNSTMIALDYAEGFQLDVAITRTNAEYVLGQFELCTVTLPMSNLAGGAYPIPVTVSEANDAEGVAVVTEASPALVNITNANGCTDATACNYDSTASNDDGSCTYVGDPCDDQDPETTNDLLQDDCSCAGEIVVSVDGCTDPEACNYNPEATTDDGSCTYVESLIISGPVTPESFSTTTYTYPETAGSTYTWAVEGGIITAGQGTASIEVVWSTEGSGNVSLTETNAEGCTGELVTLEVVIFPTNIEEQDASSFSFYPNPANTSITITADAALLNSPYRITDTQGKLVKAGVLQGATTTLDVTSLASGKYTVGITSDARVLTQTLIIQK